MNPHSRHVLPMGCADARRAKGFTLIELMIAMVLGLVIIGGVVSTLIANKRSYRTNEGLSQVQESARTAFELLARDIRQAGGTGCGNDGRIANVLAPPAVWWQDWFGLVGYDDDEDDPAVTEGTGPDNRVAGTDSLHLQTVGGNGMAVHTHNAAAATIRINAATTTIAAGDVLMVCDFDHAAILQVTAYDAGTTTLTHATGSQTPGNCSQGLGFPTSCASVSGNVYTFGRNSQIGRLVATDWYIGNNGRAGEGGRSLYRQPLGAAAPEEVVAGVTNMRLRYRLDGGNALLDADNAAITDWANVNAVAITLTMDSADNNISSNASVNAGRLQRSFTYLVAVRNRVP